MADEAELDRIVNELQIQQARGEAIKGQARELEATAVEISAAIDALENIKKAKGDALVPIGAGVFLSCPKPDSDKVMVNIGASVMLQKKPDDAARMLQERHKKVTEAITSSREDLEKIVKAIDSLTQRASALAGPEERNVRPSKE